MDAVVIEHIQKNDVEGLLQDLREGTVEACGGGPMAVVMLTAQKLKAERAYFLKYANSGDVTGDKNSVVGYMAAAFCR